MQSSTSKPTRKSRLQSETESESEPESQYSPWEDSDTESETARATEEKTQCEAAKLALAQFCNPGEYPLSSTLQSTSPKVSHSNRKRFLGVNSGRAILKQLPSGETEPETWCCRYLDPDGWRSEYEEFCKEFFQQTDCEYCDSDFDHENTIKTKSNMSNQTKIPESGSPEPKTAAEGGKRPYYDASTETYYWY